MFRQKQKPRETEREQRKKLWKENCKKRPKVDEYGDKIGVDGIRSDSVDGPRLSNDLRRLFALTGDPAFETARLVLGAYSLDKGSRIRARTFRKTMVPTSEGAHALELMDAYRREKRSIQDAAEQVVSLRGIAGASFETAVKNLARWYTQYQKTGQFPGEDELVGHTGRHVFVRRLIENELTKHLPREGKLVPDTLRWRLALADGIISMSIRMK